MRLATAAEVGAALDFPSLIDALRAAFRGDIEVPVRHHHTLPGKAEAEPTLLLMPAWRSGKTIGVKIATIFPTNAARGLPAVQASYLLLDGESGLPRALIEGASLTTRRTAAASALAADYLARADSRTLLMVGTGAMAPNLIRAHASVRPIDRVAIWGRRREKAEELAASLSSEHFSLEAVSSIEAAVREADIISCATLSRAPLVKGAWLRPGQHLDLVGAFTPDMRESDDDAVAGARVFLDTRAGATKEGGDIVQALRSGALAESEIQGDLFELCRGEVKGRANADEITLFKSVGTAIEDLAAAELVVSRIESD